MRWKPGMLGAALTLATTLAFAAECSRDIAGEWSREAAPGGTAEEAYRAEGSGWSDRIRVIQDAGRITIESSFFSRGDLQPPLRFSYVLEGTTENVVMVGHGAQRQISMARWSDCRLVITTRFPGEEGASAEIAVTQTLWLESGITSGILPTRSADTLIVDTARGGASPNRTIYRRVAVAGGS
jgi:hypothetical protein